MPTAPPDSRTRLLDAALKVIRTKGYSAMRVDDICEEAALSKGAFFHHFATKEALAVAAAAHWSEITGGLFAGAAYHAHDDPLDRVLAYIDFRKALVRGELPEFTCLVGTMVQEAYHSNPEIREACERSISGHAHTLAADIALAKRKYLLRADWSAEGLALHTQAVIQGAFIVAKARDDARLAIDSIDHLRRYIELLFQPPRAIRPRSTSKQTVQPRTRHPRTPKPHRKEKS